MPEIQNNSNPISPHIQIYKWEWTSILSILHRLSGVMLGLLIPVFVGWIGCLAIDEQTYQSFLLILRSDVGVLILNICCFSFYYHFINGVRHLAWDIGFGYSLRVAAFSGAITITLSLLATILTLRSF